MSVVYFLKPVGMDGPIKIGFTIVPLDRMRELGACLPWPIEIVATTAGERALEANIHACFADAHMHGEWFHPVNRLKEAIAKLAVGAPLEEAIDLNDRRGAVRRTARHDWTDEHWERARYLGKLRMAARNAGMLARSCDRFRLPENANAIIQRWQETLSARPTADQFAFLDKIIADPVTHCDRDPWLQKSASVTGAL